VNVQAVLGGTLVAGPRLLSVLRVHPASTALVAHRNVTHAQVAIRVLQVLSRNVSDAEMGSIQQQVEPLLVLIVWPESIRDRREDPSPSAQVVHQEQRAPLDNLLVLVAQRGSMSCPIRACLVPEHTTARMQRRGVAHATRE
jgi:hypothetical protein